MLPKQQRKINYELRHALLMFTSDVSVGTVQPATRMWARIEGRLAAKDHIAA